MAGADQAGIRETKGYPVVYGEKNRQPRITNYSCLVSWSLRMCQPMDPLNCGKADHSNLWLKDRDLSRIERFCQGRELNDKAQFFTHYVKLLQLHDEDEFLHPDNG